MGERTGLRSYYDSYEHVVDSHLRSEWDDVDSGGRSYDRWVWLREGGKKGSERKSLTIRQHCIFFSTLFTSLFTLLNSPK